MYINEGTNDYKLAEDVGRWHEVCVSYISISFISSIKN